MFGRTQVSEKESEPRILSLDAHPGYAEAKKKAEEIAARVNRASAELHEASNNLAGERAARIDREAGAVLEGKRPTDTEIRLSREVGNLTDSLEVLNRSAEMQGKVVREQRALAESAVFESFRPQLAQLEQEHSRIQAELDKLREQRAAWIEKVLRAGIRPMHGVNAYILGDTDLTHWTSMH